MNVPPEDAKSIFLAAIELPAGDEREVFLQAACGDDEPLRQRVEALIGAYEDESFLVGSVVGVEAKIEPTSAGEDPQQTVDQQSCGTSESAPAPRAAFRGASTPIAEGRGSQIGPYKLLQELGEGGMGTVYMAEQSEPVHRMVALKIIKAGMDSAQVIARFEAERQALALMDHQNIARVLDAGTTDSGRPYFVMELVKGIPITSFCDKNRLNPRQRLELMVPVCRAIQHAHQKGVIHRDIKPSNLLVTMYDGRPVPKVIDFGIAKATGQRLTEKTLFTEVGQIVGTLEYMSPEQAEMNQLDIDTRSDVYALGVVIYELLTGTTPITAQQLREAGFTEMLRTIREKEPPKPSTRISQSGEAIASISAVRGSEPARLSKTVRGELDWIVMKALEKERARRYDSPSGLASDIERFLTGDAVSACPPSSVYRLRKFARRNKVALTTTAAVAAALLLGFVISVNQAIRARKAEIFAREKAESERRTRIEAVEARNREAEQRLLAQRRTYAANSLMMQMAWEQKNLSRFADLLSAQRPRPGDLDLRGFEWRYWQRTAQRGYESLSGHKYAVADLSMTADGSHVAVAACGGRGPGEIWLWDVNSKSGRQMAVHDDRIRNVAISPDGDLIAAGIGRSGYEGAVMLWDSDGRNERVLQRFPCAVDVVSFSPDGKYLAAASQHLGDPEERRSDQPGELVVWENVSQGVPEIVFSQSDAGKSYFGMAFDAQSRRIAASSTGPEGVLVEIRDLDTAEVQVLESRPGNLYFNLAFSPDGTRLAVSSGPWGGPGMVEVWDLDTGKELPIPLRGHSGRVVGVCFNSDGTRIATCSFDGTAKVWNAETAKEIHTLRGHLGPVNQVAFSPDGSHVVSGSDDRTVRLWNAEQGQQTMTRRIGNGDIESVSFNSDGKTFAAGGADGVVTLWDSASGRTVATLEEESKARVFSIAISADDRYLAAGTDAAKSAGEILVWDLNKHAISQRLSGHSKLVSSVAFSPDGVHLASVSGHFSDPEPMGELKLWNLATGREVPLPAGHRNGYLGKAAFSPDGKLLAWSWLPTSTGQPESASVVKVFDMSDQREVYTLTTPETGAFAVAFSADSKRLAAGCVDASIRLWDLTDGEPTGILKGHKGRVHAVDFNPDGDRLVSSGQDQTIKLWDLTTHQELLTLTEHQGHIWSVDFSPDGKRIVSGSTDGSVKLWDGT